MEQLQVSSVEEEERNDEEEDTNTVVFFCHCVVFFSVTKETAVTPNSHWAKAGCPWTVV